MKKKSFLRAQSYAPGRESRGDELNNFLVSSIDRQGDKTIWTLNSAQNKPIVLSD